MKRSDFHVGGSYRRSASFPAPAVSSPTRRRLAAGLDRKDLTVAKGLPGPDDPPLLDGSEGFYSGGIHGVAWHQNVGKMSNLPTLFDQRVVAHLERF